MSCVRCWHSGALVCATDHCGLCTVETVEEVEELASKYPSERAMETIARMIQEEGHE